jgi:hypothetical protein
MPDDTGPLHKAVAVTTDFSVLLREIGVVALFCLLFFWPAAFKSLLNRAGIKTVPTPFGDIDVATTGDTVATLSRGLSDSVAELQKIQGTITNPTDKTDVANLATYLGQLQKQAQDTDTSLKANLVNQQVAAGQESSSVAKPAGWLFAGHVSDDKNPQWSGEGERNVPPGHSAAFAVGDTFAVTAAAYLRDDAPSGAHFGGKVVYVVPANAQVKVVADPQYSHAIAGGYFLWLKVQPQ